MILPDETIPNTPACYTVLVVESLPVDQELCQRYLLADAGVRYSFLEADSTATAVSVCQCIRIDGVLVDSVPNVTMGLELIEELEIHMNGYRPPVVIVAGESDPAVVVRAIKLGAEDYLVKQTLTPEQLQVAMRSAIENTRLRLQLQHQEDRFRISVENMLDCFGIYTAIRNGAGQIVDFRIDYLNAAALESNQMTPADIGKGLCELLPAHQEAGLFEEYCRVVETGEPLIKEDLIYTDVFGSQQLTRAYEARISKLNDGFVASWREVTARKQGEVELQTANQQITQQLAEIEAIYATAPVGLCFVDADLRFVRINEQLAEINGSPVSEHLGRTLREILPEQADELEPLYRQVITSGEPILNLEVQGTNRAQPGVLRHWLVCYYPQKDVNQRVVGVNAMVQEITDRKRHESARRQSEAALQESEQRFRAIFNTTFQFVGLLSPNGILLEANQTALDFAGLTREAAIGRPFWEVRWWTISTETQRQLRAAIARASQGEFVRYEVEVLGVGDRTATVDFSLKPVRDESGQVVLLIPEGRDVSDRLRNEGDHRRMEAKLREREEQLWLFVKYAPADVAMFDREMRYVAVSDHWLTSYRLVNQEVVGRSHYEIFPEIPDRWKQIHQRCLAGAIERCEEDLFPRADGSTDWVRWEIHPWHTNTGSIGGIIVFSEVITERKQAEMALRQSEERYRSLAGLIPQLVWIVQPDGSMLDVNDRWVAYTGFTLEQIQSLGWQAIVHPEDLPPIAEAWMTAQEDGSYYQAEGRKRRADGVYRWHLFQAMSLRDEQGRIAKWFGTSTDIHAAKLIEAERLQLLTESEVARAEAEAANRSKDEFVSLVAHELRSPLNAIMGWAKLLQTRQLDVATASKALETIVRNAHSQAQLIEDLLDVSRMVRGTLQMNFVPVRFIEVIQTAIETIRPTAEAKYLQLALQLSPVPTLQGDVSRLQQVVLNLLTNAIKFTPEGGQIQVLLNHGSTELQLQVRDTGKGISPDFLPYIFERFRQDQQNTATKQGLGLGLAIVKYIVEQHGGTVAAESQGEGKGATFTVSLPLLQQGKVLQDGTFIPALLDDLSQGLAGVRVLLVDDVLDMLNLTTLILEQEGAVVQTAASGILALQCFQSFQPDILVSDIAMPEMDGYELLQQVRQIDPGGGIPAIALTAYASEARREDSVRAGFACHLTKPVEPEELVSVILNAM